MLLICLDLIRKIGKKERNTKRRIGTDQTGKFCAKHSNRGFDCFCDEDRDRAAQLHRVSGFDDGFGGYLCICGGGRFSAKYGCITPNLYPGEINEHQL